MSCGRARKQMVEALAGRAGEAERLELELHLDGCAGCRRDHATMASIRRLQTWEPPALSDGARERVRREALAASQTGGARSPSPRRLVWAVTGGGAFAVAALAGFLALRAPSSRILDGDVTIVSGGRFAALLGIADRARLRGGGHLLLDGVKVELDGELAWRAGERAIVLERGRVRVEVDPARRQPFAVLTPRFRVDVLGTVFDVDLDGVRTARGKVKVSVEGRELAQVAAGESWSIAPPAPPPAPVAAPPAPAIAAPAAPARASEDLSATLERARRALGRGDGASTRAILAPVHHGPRELVAEARLLEAESFLVERRYRDAIERYRRVLSAFGDTAHAESALYAIAQLEVDSGSPDAAERALHRYLDRYPRGRFAGEARARLASLLRR
jgi:hypothetical protein